MELRRDHAADALLASAFVGSQHFVVVDVQAEPLDGTLRDCVELVKRLAPASLSVGHIWPTER